MKKVICFPSKRNLDSSEYFNNYIKIKDQLLKNVNKKELKSIIKEILIAAKKQRNIFSCGNGGSASTA